MTNSIQEMEYESHINVLNEIISEFSDLINKRSLIPKKLKVALHEVADDYTVMRFDLSGKFINAVSSNTDCRFISFHDIPITKQIDTYNEPLILISDENELDSSTCELVRIRHEKGYITFPIIIFSDSFFRLTYGECCSYSQVIDTFEEAVKEKVMVFMKSDFKNLPKYLCCLQSLVKIHICLNQIKKLSKIINFDSQEEKVSKIERYEKKFTTQIAIWNAEILKIREECDKRVAEMLLNIDADNLSSFALNIDLKYGNLHQYISDFLASQYMNKNYSIFRDELMSLIEDTQTEISNNVAKLSLIGTFSSGKTTLINTFLGKREIPLRTSAGHNTAVLMHLYYEPSNKEYYEINYKDNLIWTVVKPASMEKIPINKEKSRIRIQNVEEISGGYRISYRIINSRKTQSRTIRTVSAITIKKGDTLEPGEPFVQSTGKISNNVELCSKKEIALLIEQIQKSKDCSLTTLNGDEQLSLKKILTLLRRIGTIAGKKNTTISYNKLCETIKIPPKIDKLTQKSELPNHYRRIEVACPLHLTNKRIELDRQGWINLCGNPDPSQNSNDTVFSEDPSCYMLAKELNLHINAEFLQYCSLTDTPGFGSVTEEHDAITERYIRDNTGRLLVMIAINAKTIDAKYQDLINSVSDIYDNFRRKDKKNVVFILNCFTNLSSEERLKTHVDAVSKILVMKGFELKNIFVCNLRDALVEKQEKELMFGYPSYSRFHEYIIREMISSDLTGKYKGIKNNWKKALSGFKTRIDNQLYELNKGLNNAVNSKDDLIRDINATENIYIDVKEFDTLKDIFQDWYDRIIDAFINNRKGLIKHPRLNALMESLEIIETDLQDTNDTVYEEIFEYYQGCINSLSYDTDISKPKLPELSNNIVVLELISLKSLLKEADAETNWFNKSKKNNFYINKIELKINNGLNNTIEKVKNYSNKCYKVVDKYKKRIINEKRYRLANMKDEITMQNALTEAEDVKRQICDLEREFKKIKFNL